MFTEEEINRFFRDRERRDRITRDIESAEETGTPF